MSRPGTAYYKTKLCTMFESTGACPYGNMCSFAHGQEDLREVPRVSTASLMQRKTKLCNKFNTPQGCPYGDRCNFLHDMSAQPFTLALPAVPGQGQEPFQQGPPPGAAQHQGGGGPPTVPLNYKTRMCVRFESEAGCPFGDKCHFAHGQADLRTIAQNRATQNINPQMCMEVPGGRPGEAQHRAFNPPNAPVSFLFVRRDLEPKPVELIAPPLDPDSIISKIRDANQQKAEDEWREKGGSDIYADRVNHLVAT